MATTKYAIQTARKSIRTARRIIKEKTPVAVNENFKKEADAPKINSRRIETFLKLVKDL